MSRARDAIGRESQVESALRIGGFVVRDVKSRESQFDDDDFVVVSSEITLTIYFVAFFSACHRRFRVTRRLVVNNNGQIITCIAGHGILVVP